MTGLQDEISELSEDICHVSLTHDHLDVPKIMDTVRSPAAGAIVLFAGAPGPTSHPVLALTDTLQGTTRDSFAGKPVKELQYTSYNNLALRTMLSICKDVATKHGLKGIAMVHRLGTVPIGEESILIAVSSPHRQAAWRAGEEALEECKKKAEIWKKEEFEGGEGIWRANRDGAMGEKVES